MLKYIKSAFMNRWNILALVAGTGIGVISGRPDILFPLVIAGEVLYLGMLGTNSKYQQYVNAQEHKEKKAKTGHSQQQQLRRMTRALPRQLLERYDDLRQRCLDLHEIAANLRRTDDTGFSGSLDSLQVEGLDRLLWIFLRLLYTKHSLYQFLRKTSVDGIQQEMARTEERLKKLDETDASHHQEKLRRTLSDNLETCRQRLDNYEKARSNHEYVELEIDRLENKIKSLAELAVNRREHDFISTQVDEVADSMVETEKTITELDFATGFDETDTQVPDLLRPPIQYLDEA